LLDEHGAAIRAAMAEKSGWPELAAEPSLGAQAP
jgi:hypothetical protein